MHRITLLNNKKLQMTVTECNLNSVQTNSFVNSRERYLIPSESVISFILPVACKLNQKFVKLIIGAMFQEKILWSYDRIWNNPILSGCGEFFLGSSHNLSKSDQATMNIHFKQRKNRTQYFAALKRNKLSHLSQRHLIVVNGNN